MSAPKPASAYLDDPNYKTGYMTKQGVHWKTWKRRLFILDIRNKVLSYYVSPQDTVPKGKVELEGYTVAEANDSIKKPHSFQILKEGARTYYFFCDDRSSKITWMADIMSTLEARIATLAIDEITIFSPFQTQGVPTFPMEFIVSLQGHGRVWTVTYKYQDFLAFHSLMSVMVPMPPLPPQSLADSREMNDILQTQGALKTYLLDLVFSPNLEVASHPLLRRFLNYRDPPRNVPTGKQGLARFFPEEIEGIPLEVLFHTAALRGNLEAIKEILAMGLDVNTQNSQEYDHSAFSGACQNGRAEVLRFLLDHPDINVNIRTAVGATGLFMACQLNKEEVVQILLADNRVNLCIPDGNGTSPFFAAAQFGFWGLLQRLVTRAEVNVNQKMNDGRLPLWQSTRNVRILTMAELFASGRLLDLEGTFSTSPIILLWHLEQLFPSFSPDHMARVELNRDTMKMWFLWYYNDSAKTCALMRKALGRPATDLEKFLGVQLSVCAQSNPPAFQAPVTLKELALPDCCLLSIPPKLLLCSGLQKLNIRDNLLVDLPVDFFQHLPALVSLDLSGNPIRMDFPWGDWFKGSHLKELIFHEGQFGSWTPDLKVDVALICRLRDSIEGRLQLVEVALRKQPKPKLPLPSISFDPQPEMQHFFWVGPDPPKHLEHLKKTFPASATKFHAVSTIDEIATKVKPAVGPHIRFCRIILVGQQGQIFAPQIAALEERTSCVCGTFAFVENARLQHSYFIEYYLRNNIGQLGSTLEELVDFCSGSPVDLMLKRYLGVSDASLTGPKIFYSFEVGSIKQMFASMTMKTRSGKDLKEIFVCESRLQSDFMEYRFGGTSATFTDASPVGEFNFVSTAEIGKELFESLGCVLPPTVALWRDKICESLTLFWINHRSTVKDAEFMRVVRPLLIPDEKISPALFDAAIFYVYTMESFFYQNMARVFATRKYDEVIYFKYFVNYFISLLFSRRYDQYVSLVYRGYAISEDQKATYAPGMEIFFPGFASCSKGRAKPEKFALDRKSALEKSTGKRFYTVLLEITPLQKELLERLPALPHTNIDLENFSAISGEQEVLYPPMATFVIEQVEIDESTSSIRIVARDSRNQCFANFFTTVSRSMRDERDGIVSMFAPSEFEGLIAYHEALAKFQCDWNANYPEDPVSYLEKSGVELLPIVTFDPHGRLQLAELFCKKGNLLQLRRWWETGERQVAEFLIYEKNADPNGVNATGDTPLSMACRGKRLNMVQFLLSLSEVDVNKTILDGSTPFFAACALGCLEIVQSLAAHPGVDTRTCQKDGVSPATIATWGGHLEVLRFLVETLKHDPTFYVTGVETALEVAVRKKHILCVEYLLNRPNIDVNKGEKGPLVRALANRDQRMVRLLVEKGGAKVHPDLLAVVIKTKDTQMAKILLQDPEVDVGSVQEGPSPFQLACYFGDPGAVKTMLSRMKAPEINAEFPKTNATGFQAACQEGHVSVVLELLGDSRVRTSGGLTSAIAAGHFLIIEILFTANRFTKDQLQGEVKAGMQLMMRLPLEASHRVQVKGLVRELLETALGPLSQGSFRDLLRALE